MKNNGNIDSYKESGFLMSNAKTYFTLTADTVRVKPLMLALPYAQLYGSKSLLESTVWNSFSYIGS